MNIHDAFKSLNFVSSLIGLPSCNLKDGQRTEQSLFNTLVTISKAACIIIISIWSLYGKIRDVYSSFDRILVVLDAAVTMTLLLLYVTQVLLPITIFRRKYLQIYELIESVETHLRCSQQMLVVEKRAINRLLAVGNVIVLGIICYDTWAWNDVLGFFVFKFYISRIITIYVMSMSVVQMISLLMYVNHRFQLINSKFPRSPFDNKSVELFGTIQEVLPISILSKAHHIICNIVDTVNTAYGSTVVIFTLCIIFSILQTMYIFLTTVMASEIFKGVDNANSIIVLNLVWSFYFACLLFVITSVCQSTSSLGNRTAVVAHKLLLESFVTEEESDMLAIFAYQVSERTPTFTGCGFFTVDLSLMYNVTGAVISYLVVLLQFHGLSFGSDEKLSHV